MKFNSARLVVCSIAASLAVPITAAAAVTIDFTTIGAPGNTGSSSFVDPGTGLTVQGFYFDDTFEEWTGVGANLYIRNQANDHGLGVCSAPESPCPGPDNFGDINELDNAGPQELIRLALPAGYRWVSVQLSSLDNNGGDGFEYGQLWTDADGDPLGLDTVLWPFRGDGPIEPSFGIPGSAATAPYLFFQPFDWSPGGLNVNNDFLVYQVTIDRPQVPEPATIGILGIGLLALGRMRRKR